MKIFNYQGERVLISRAQYNNGRVALVLKDLMGLLYTKVTVNIPEEELKDREIIIKDYAENTGMLQWLLDNNIVSIPHDFVPSGHIICVIANLLPEIEWKGEEVSVQEYEKLISEYIL